MKIPLQLKIAELEARIEKLERSNKTVTVSEFTPSARKEWSRMWKHFDRFFKEMFHKLER